MAATANRMSRRSIGSINVWGSGSRNHHAMFAHNVALDDPVAVKVFHNESSSAPLNMRVRRMDRVVPSKRVLRDVGSLYFRCPWRATSVKTRMYVSEGQKLIL